MGFETVILTKVANILGADHRAEFTAGSLFVQCSRKEAEKLLTYFRRDNQVLMTECPDEFAFDWVA